MCLAGATVKGNYKNISEETQDIMVSRKTTRWASGWGCVGGGGRREGERGRLK